MKTSSEPHIVQADRLKDGVLITFSDTTTALYSASLLREILPKAQKLEDVPEESD